MSSLTDNNNNTPDSNFSLKDNQVSTIIKRYEFAGAEQVAGLMAKMLNENNRDKTKSYFVRKDAQGCYIVEIQELPKTEAEDPEPGPKIQVGESSGPEQIT